MSFAAKLMAYSAAASIIMASSPILNAETIHLEYKDYKQETPIAQRMWGDLLPDSTQLNGVPSISVAEVHRDGVNLEISMLFATNQCGINECPVRVFQDGHKIEDTMGCVNLSTHAVADSLRALVMCDDVKIINRK